VRRIGSYSLPPGPKAVPTARTAVEDFFPSHVSDEVRNTVRLLVSEVVTNGVRHGSASEPVELDVRDRGDELEVEVRDLGDGFAAAPRRMATDEVGGWGLFLVEQLADRWGVAQDSGTRVWFTVSAH
jgi:anti-sigma regulatory factor (Ser/Thr protein kinase)